MSEVPFTYILKAELRGPHWYGRLQGPDLINMSRDSKGRPYKGSTAREVYALAEAELKSKDTPYVLLMEATPSEEDLASAMTVLTGLAGADRPLTIRVCAVESEHYSGEWTTGFTPEGLNLDKPEGRHLTDAEVTVAMRKWLRAKFWMTRKEADSMVIEVHRHTVSDEQWEDRYFPLTENAEKHCAREANRVDGAALKLSAQSAMLYTSAVKPLVVNNISMGINRWGGVFRDVCTVPWPESVTSEEGLTCDAAELARAAREAGEVLAGMTVDTAEMLMWGAGSEYALYAHMKGL